MVKNGTKLHTTFKACHLYMTTTRYDTWEAFRVYREREVLQRISGDDGISGLQPYRRSRAGVHRPVRASFLLLF